VHKLLDFARQAQLRTLQLQLHGTEISDAAS
jgi:hypothetical protein